MPFPEDIFPNNQEVLNAFNLAEFTSRPLYITGKAGTGKSTFLKHYCKNTHKNFLVLAPTGLAALNVGGQTIHSFFGLPWRPLQPNDKEITYFPQAKFDENGNLDQKEHPKRKIISNVDVIIIDEISMVRCDIIDAIDNSLRKNGGNSSLPFGGKQIICIGDLFQLEPVVVRRDLPIISKFYSSPFFFSAKVFERFQFSNIEFLKVYRQSDPNFIGLLDKIRNNTASTIEFTKLHERFNPAYEPEEEQYFIILCTTNAIADTLNDEHLQKLITEEHYYVGETTGDFGQKLPSLLNLKLKVDSQVMFVKNDSGGRWVNGTIGKITELDDDSIKVIIKHDEEEIEYSIERVVWEKIEYTWSNETEEIAEEVVGTFTQYPLKLAWAITIHKSQGLTFDQVVINTGTGMFAHGQCYVALSRCTTFEGLVFQTQLNPTDVRVDNRVVEMANAANNQNTINDQLMNGLLGYSRRLVHQNNSLKTAKKKLEDLVSEQQTRLTSIEARNQSLETQINERENKVAELLESLESTSLELGELKSENKRLNLQIQSNQKSLVKLSGNLKNCQQQIESLNKRKWYHLLFGIK